MARCWCSRKPSRSCCWLWPPELKSIPLVWQLCCQARRLNAEFKPSSITFRQLTGEGEPQAGARTFTTTKAPHPLLEDRLPFMHLVLVALGVPRQETWSERVSSEQQGLWMGVGGSFDVWAGVKKRAPAWMCRYRIEWLYRLIQEPSRWRRMLSLPAFAWAVLRGS